MTIMYEWIWNRTFWMFLEVPVVNYEHSYIALVNDDMVYFHTKTNLTNDRRGEIIQNISDIKCINERKNFVELYLRMNCAI